MKTIFITIFVFTALLVKAQTDCDISLGVYFAGNSSKMTEQNKNYLKNIVSEAISEGSSLTSIEDSQFGVIVTTDIVDEHIIPGAPTKYVLNITLSMSIGDLQDGKQFSTLSIDLNGIGNSKGKAYNNAIHKLKSQNKTLTEFTSKAQDHIIGYYNKNYKAIIKKAETDALMRNYEEALYRLLCIPVCCHGYDEAMIKVRSIYKQFIDQQCHENVAQAQAAWMSGFTRENAAVASIFLSEIYPDAACYGDAMELANEIKRHMGEEWKFEMKKWSDKISVDAQQLKFAREIALAYAQNQPHQVIHY